MNLLAARVTLRERTLADVLDLALPFCLLNRRTLSRLALAVLGPIACLAAWLRLARHWGWGALWTVVLEASFLVEGAFTVALGELLFTDDGQTSARALLRRWRSRLVAYLYVVLSRQLLVAISALLVFLPFIQGPETLFVGEVLLLERGTNRSAWSRSRGLARNRKAFCLGLWLATLALPALGALAADQIGNAVVGFALQLGRPTGDLLTQGGSGFAVAGALLAAPIAAAARFLGYIDLRTRKEGWDIQLRFVALARRTALTGRAA